MCPQKGPLQIDAMKYAEQWCEMVFDYDIPCALDIFFRSWLELLATFI